MVREGGQRYVVVRVEPDSLGVALRRVLLAIVGEALGELTQVAVDDPFVGGIPGRGELAVGLGDDGVEEALESCLQLAVLIARRTVVQPHHHRAGYCPVVLEDVEYVVEGAALAVVELAVQAYILTPLVAVGVADDKHFGEVEVTLPYTDELVLEEALCRIGPAGS